MNKFISILSILLFLFSCEIPTIRNKKASTLIIEKNNKNEIQEEKANTMLLTSSSSIEPSKEIQLHTCSFTIVINNIGDTTHWSTKDNNFRTPEGFQVGTKWNELPIELQNSVNRMTGWGYYIKLKSGWQLGFCEGSSCTDAEPNKKSKVDWVFKINNRVY